MKTLFSLLIIILAVAACSPNHSESTQDTNGLRPLTIATLPAMDIVPIFIARDLGFFEAEGLTVHLEQFSSGGERDMAFQAQGSIDALLTDLVAVNIFQEAGLDIVAVFSTIGITSVVGTAGVTTMADLQGQEVLITFNTAMEYVMDRALLSAGLTMADVVGVSVPPLPTRLEMLLAGNGAGAVMPEPFVSMATDQGLIEIISSHGLNINPFTISFRRSVVENYPAELAAFYRAVNNAIDFINTADREAFIDIIIREVGYPQEARDTLVVPPFPRYTTPQIHHVEDVIEFAYSRGLTSQRFSPESQIADISN